MKEWSLPYAGVAALAALTLGLSALSRRRRSAYDRSHKKA
jgi:MYXO-CTERM domain-containing protein